MSLHSAKGNLSQLNVTGDTGVSLGSDTTLKDLYIKAVEGIFFVPLKSDETFDQAVRSSMGKTGLIFSDWTCRGLSIRNDRKVTFLFWRKGEEGKSPDSWVSKYYEFPNPIHVAPTHGTVPVSEGGDNVPKDAVIGTYTSGTSAPRVSKVRFGDSSPEVSVVEPNRSQLFSLLNVSTNGGVKEVLAMRDGSDGQPDKDGDWHFLYLLSE